MSAGLKLTGLLLAGVLCLPVLGRADTETVHRSHKAKKQQSPPLPSGTQGPVPQIPLDAIPAVAPEVTFQDGLLTIVAPNSTLGDILRGVRKNTSAEIEIPASATERVVTRLGPGPARLVMAELLNGSRFNYILMGSPEDANALVRVVLVAKVTPDIPGGVPPGAAPPQPQVANAAAAPPPDADTPDEPDDAAEQGTAEAEQPAAQPDQPGVKTPQQMLQEMQQRQLQLQQQTAGQPGQPGQQVPYPPPPGAAIQSRPPQQTPPDQQ
jgi:hypothetical protein